VEEISSNQAPLTHRSEINVPLNNSESSFSTKLSFKIRYTLLKRSDDIFSIPLHLGYEITNAYKAEIQPLYNDCIRFKKLYFSIQLDDLYISNEFRKVHNDKKYELIFSCRCFIDDKVHSFFNSVGINKNVILYNLKNDPSLVD
ncbi:conserved Plasmodium protein, unknown function, partial [Plasmodium malariae]